MTATLLQAWIAVVAALLAGALGILKYFSYRTRRDRISLVGQAFNSTVEGLSSDAKRRSWPLQSCSAGSSIKERSRAQPVPLTSMRQSPS
jgi:hypothetical protein